MSSSVNNPAALASVIVRSARTTTGRSIIFPLSAITPEPFFFRFLYGGDDGLGLLDIFLRRSEHLIDHLDLARIYIDFPSKPRVLMYSTSRRKVSISLRLEKNSIESVNTGGTGSHHNCFSGQTQLIALFRTLCLEIRTIVLRTRAIPIIRGEDMAIS